MGNGLLPKLEKEAAKMDTPTVTGMETAQRRTEIKPYSAPRREIAMQRYLYYSEMSIIICYGNGPLGRQ
jgi:hypothetical protein